MKLQINIDPGVTRRKSVARVIATVMALSVLVGCMVCPLIAYALVQGLRLESDVPENAIWLVVAGGGLGAGAAFVTFRAILRRAGFSSEEIAESWHGKRRNT